VGGRQVVDGGEIERLLPPEDSERDIALHALVPLLPFGGAAGAVHDDNLAVPVVRSADTAQAGLKQLPVVPGRHDDADPGRAADPPLDAGAAVLVAHDLSREVAGVQVVLDGALLCAKGVGLVHGRGDGGA
jgi:hypothetical protein